MAKRIPPSPTSPARRGTADEGTQYERQALTHEDGDAETNGASTGAPDAPDEAEPHEARQSVARDAQTAQARKQSDPAWLGASTPKRGKAEAGDKGSSGGHGYAPEIAHGKDSGYGPADAAPGAHPRFGRESAYGPHDDYAGTGRDAGGAQPTVKSPSQAGDVDWPEGTVGVQPEGHGRTNETDERGIAGQATGSRGRSGGSAERGRASPGVDSKPRETAPASVHTRSRRPAPADVAIHDEIRKVLSAARDLDVTHVEVTVTSGLVLLTGYVPERWMQHVVQTEVGKVAGVSGVDNQLHERRGKAMSRPGESQEGHKI